VALTEKALQLDPGNLESRMMLAEYLVEAGRLEEASDRYRAVVESEPSDPSPRFDRSLGCELPPQDYAQCNWHMFQVLLPETAERNLFITRMREAGIGVGVHYPAMHLFSLFRGLGWRPGQFPHAERIGRSTVSLPMFPAMQDADVDRVIAAIGPALAGSARP
jgi:dTDP-4-amino-4,6-dideoxygalactose transaminase